VLRSYRRPQRAQVGGKTRALTSSARIRVAHRSTYEIRIGPLIPLPIGRTGPKIYPPDDFGKIGL
jgi:hypothetical protein